MKPVTYIVNKRDPSVLTYNIFHWQHKGKPFADALDKMGWRKTGAGKVHLLDHDIHNRKKIIELNRQRGVMTIVYPHSVIPEWWYGAEFMPSPLVSFRFSISRVHRIAWSRTYPEVNIETCGWPFSDIKPFKPCSSPQKILFAPIHPSENPTLRPEAQRANHQVLQMLTANKTKYQVRVRYLGELYYQGLEEVPGIEFVQGKPDGSTEDIEWADVVISDQTFMFISAALGKPVIGISQSVCPRANNLLLRQSDDWKKWWHLVRHPLSHDEETLDNLIKEACSNEFAEWKQMNIGERMQPKRIDAIIKRYLKEHRRN